jgi:hypothetical protein
MAVFTCQQSTGRALATFATQIGSIGEMTIRHFRDQSEIPTEQEIKMDRPTGGDRVAPLFSQSQAP